MKHRYRRDKRKPDNTLKSIKIIDNKTIMGVTASGERMLISSKIPDDSFKAKEGDKLMIQNEFGLYIGTFLKSKWDMRVAVSCRIKSNLMIAFLF